MLFQVSDVHSEKASRYSGKLWVLVNIRRENGHINYRLFWSGKFKISKEDVGSDLSRTLRVAESDQKWNDKVFRWFWQLELGRDTATEI